EQLDLTRTVGWFTSIYPVRLEAREGEGEGEVLKRTKEKLRRVKGKGVGYSILRYKADEQTRQRMSGIGGSGISFNYLGQTDQVLRPGLEGWAVAKETMGRTQSGEQERKQLLDVVGMVREGRLELRAIYSANHYTSQSIQRLLEEYTNALASIITHCKEQGAGGHTPSDFSLAGLDEKRLEKIASLLEKFDSLEKNHL